MAMATDNSYAEALGRNIRAARQAAGLSQQALADAAGISRSFLSEIETGDKIPGTDVFQALANALRRDLKKILPPIPKFC
jgi:transcriptional regulator with XRE-family HTH domain